MLKEILEGNYLHDLVRFEMPSRFSRKAVLIIGGQSLALGTVIAQTLTAGAVSAANGGNTGDGVLTVDAVDPVLAKAMVGVYSVTCLEAEANLGIFRVSDPNGFALGTVDVGEVFENQIKFSIADGGGDFVEGDSFTVTVASGSDAYSQIDFTATDGTEVAAGVLIGAADATDNDVASLALVRTSRVMPSALVWPDGTTEQQKIAALKQLEKLDILAATEA